MKLQAIETYFPNGWKARVLVTIQDRQPEWVEIKACPIFEKPTQAIEWAKKAGF